MPDKKYAPSVEILELMEIGDPLEPDSFGRAKCSMPWTASSRKTVFPTPNAALSGWRAIDFTEEEDSGVRLVSRCASRCSRFSGRIGETHCPAFS